MNIQEIHFMREVLLTDFQGKETTTMEVSLANASYLHPTFRGVSFYDLDAVKALYVKLGGSRRDGEKRGSTVIIPNRSRWATLRGISAEEVQVVERAELLDRSAPLQPLHTEESRARNRRMRD